MAICLRLHQLILVGVLTLLVGCVTDPVLLLHPQTQKEKQCGPYYFTGMSSGMLSKNAALERERVCIDDYEQEGYERITKAQPKSVDPKAGH
jgi:hypothetical protein